MKKVILLLTLLILVYMSPPALAQEVDERVRVTGAEDRGVMTGVVASIGEGRPGWPTGRWSGAGFAWGE